MKTRDDKMTSNTWSNRNCGPDGKIKPSYLKQMKDYAEYKQRFLDVRKNWVDSRYDEHMNKMMMCWCRGNPDYHKNQKAPFDKCSMPIEEEEGK